MFKFDFSIITRYGLKIESIIISGFDQADAERKLRQMYIHCDVVNCGVRQSAPTMASMSSFEDILSLISR